MENFIYNENFYNDLSELLIYEEWDVEDIEILPDDYKLEVECTDLESIIKIDSDWIIERIDEERFPDESDIELRIKKVLENNIDFDKINSELPKVYYGNRKKHYFSKHDLLDAL